MMKRVGFKKYTIFLLVCFFALLLSINAYNNGHTESFVLEFGATQSIPDQQHINFKCSGALTYYGLTNTGSGYTVTQLIKAPSGNEIIEEVNCEWTGSTSLGVENNEAGSATFKFYVVTEEETTPNGGDDSETSEDSEDPEEPEEPTNTTKYLSLGLDSWDINMLTALKAYSITSFVPDDKNVDYISITGCNTAGGETKECFVGVSDLLLQQVEQDGYIGQDYISLVTVKYKKKEDGVEHTANVRINIIANGTARIWDNHTSQNRPGTCSYNSGEWRKASYERSNGARVHFYEAVNVGEKLPDCTANANYIVPVEFKGWIVGVEGTTGVSEQMLNNSQIRYFGACDAAIAPGTASQRGMNYAPCYEAAPFVQVSIPSGTVEEPGWKMLREGNGYYYTANDPNATITLPDIVFSGYDANSKVRYWYNSADPSKQYDVGTSVPLDGSTYIAVVDSLIQTINNYKTIHLNDTVVFSVEGMQSCSLGGNNASAYLDVADQNSDCRVTGKALTGELYGEQLPIITVTLEGGTRDYYFTVLSSVGEDSGGDNGFIIDTSSNTEAGSDGANSSDYFSKVCPDFRIAGKEGNNSKQFGTSAVNGSTALKSTLYEVDSTGDVTNCNYVAVCLDPGRLGPPSGGIKYSKVQDISADTEFGRLVTYIASLNKMNEFTKLNSTFRVGAHVASRIVALQTGFTASPDYSDVTYMSYYEAYKAVADNLTLGETDVVAIQNALAKGIKFVNDADNWAGGNAEGKGTVYSSGPSPDHSVYSNVVNFLANYPAIDKNKGKFERDITDKWAEDGATDDTAFKVYYEATLTAPEGITIEDITPNCNGYAGITCNVDDFNQTGTLADSRKQYYLKVHFDVESTQVSELPLTQEEKMNLSYKITYSGGMVADNIFIASPQEDAASYQRMLVFNASSPDLYTYFPPIIEDCDLPGLDYKKYCNASSCDETNFNKVLFKASGCCEYVTDEKAYAYVMNSVCSAKCTSSTMAPVCSYNATYDGSADLYEINEGAYFAGHDAQGNRTLKPNIGAKEGDYRDACVANISDHYGTDSLVDHDDGRSTTAFQKNDDNGNSRNVEYYKNNRYCQVTCKEDWQLSMDSFGNYVGKDAVAAGHYFQIDKNDLFISGSRTCYSTYINYIQFLQDLVALSNVSKNGYNTYSAASHAWSDLACQTSNDEVDGEAVVCNSNNEGAENDYEISLTPVQKCDEWERYYQCTGGSSHAGGDDTVDDCECPEVAEGETSTCTAGSIEKYRCLEHSYMWTATLNVGSSAEQEHFAARSEEEQGGDGEYTTYDLDSLEERGMEDTSSDTVSNKQDPTGTNKYSHSFNNGETCSVTVNKVDGGSDSFGSYCYGGPTHGGEIGMEDRKSYSGPDAAAGDSDAKHAIKNAFEHLQPELSKQLDATRKGGYSDLTWAYKDAKERIEEMFDCQHFQVYNTSDDLDAEKKNNSIMQGKYYPKESRRDYVRIDTAYEPFVSYTYDEPGYMTILNEDNILVPFDEKNDSVFKDIGKYKESTNESVKTNLKINGNSTIQVELSRNKLEFAYFDRTQPFTGIQADTYGKDANNNYVDAQYGKNKNSSLADSIHATKNIVFCTISGDPSQTYNYAINRDPAKGMLEIGMGAAVTPEWNGGNCYQLPVPYLKATYISSSISNSSFFKNKGKWFGKGSDVKEHGEFLRDALKNANNYRNIGYDVEKEFKSATWSPIGNFNVFPVSINTPRNLYTYTYTFAQIGSFDDGELGRIMGSDTAIISYNDRTCFYEVFEEICLCCGDEINSYVYSETTQQITKDFLNANSLPGNSSKDSISQNSGGTLSFASSSVTLTDVDSDGGITSSRPTTSNWGTQAPFTYAGEYDLTTSKGDAAKTQIEKLGETIYSRTPEYSYYLTPSTLSAIREYNSKHGYEVSYNNLRVVGKQASIAPVENSCSNPASDDCWTADIEKMNNEVINFQHYGSTFLEEFMKPYAYEGTLADSTNEKVCLVTEAQLAADPELVSKMIDTQQCRWIDYVEDISNNTAGLQTFSIFEGDTETEIKYFRLAFK